MSEKWDAHSFSIIGKYDNAWILGYPGNTGWNPTNGLRTTLRCLM
jgi:hypothetical protein